jgi:proteasome lid subunit RPN8/RPN11
MPVRPWRMWLSEKAEWQMVEAASAIHPRETGGVLVGVLVGGRPWVAEAVHIPSQHSTHTTYELPTGARRRAVEHSRSRDPRVGYLGDWHSHPADVEPSRTDSGSMALVAVDSDAGCDRPVLLVLRRRDEGYALDARQWTGASLRRLRVVLAGPLPPVDSGRVSPTRGSAKLRRRGLRKITAAVRRRA